MKNELTWASENSCFLLGMGVRSVTSCDLQSIPSVLESEGISQKGSLHLPSAAKIHRPRREGSESPSHLMHSFPTWS